MAQETKSTKTAGDKFRAWVKSILMQLFDAVSVVVVLALAVRGAVSFIDVASHDVKLGAGIIVVGVFSARLIERVFPSK